MSSAALYQRAYMVKMMLNMNRYSISVKCPAVILTVNILMLSDEIKKFHSLLVEAS